MVKKGEPTPTFRADTPYGVLRPLSSTSLRRTLLVVLVLCLWRSRSGVLFSSLCRDEIFDWMDARITPHIVILALSCKYGSTVSTAS
jgi:hypothetical protein